MYRVCWDNLWMYKLKGYTLCEVQMSGKYGITGGKASYCQYHGFIYKLYYQYH